MKIENAPQNIPATKVNIHWGHLGGRQNVDSPKCWVVDMSCDEACEKWFNNGIFMDEQDAINHKEQLLKVGSTKDLAEQIVEKIN